MTGQRRVVLKVLSESTDHPDADLVYRRAAKLDPRISIATVYRTVHVLQEAHILDRHDFGGNKARYEEHSESHHDHLIDVRSGKVVEFNNPRHRRAAAAGGAGTRLSAGRTSPGVIRRAADGCEETQILESIGVAGDEPQKCTLHGKGKVVPLYPKSDPFGIAALRTRCRA